MGLANVEPEPSRLVEAVMRSVTVLKQLHKKTGGEPEAVRKLKHTVALPYRIEEYLRKSIRGLEEELKSYE